MRYVFLTVLMLAAFLGRQPLGAQTLAQAEADYQKYARLKAGGTNDAAAYAALYKCYQNFSAILNSAPANSPEYVESKKALRKIHPSLQDGVRYSSSRGSRTNALLFAQAFIDVPLMKAFEGELLPHDDYFPTIAYLAASGTYNAGDYERAIKYFKVYLGTGDQKNRKNVFKFMVKACMKTNDHKRAAEAIEDACNSYPNDYQMLSIAINNCLERNDNENLQKYVSKAMAIKPNDKTLLNIQGKLYEDTQEFQKALNIYNQMLSANPNSLTITRHVALNYYNLGVINYNKAEMETNEKDAKRYSRLATDYFTAAVSKLEPIVANDPGNIKYMEMLAMAYSCMNYNDKLSSLNSRLTMMGGAAVERNAVPPLMSYDGSTMSAVSAATASNAASASEPDGYSSGEVPRYSVFAKEYVESHLRKWQEKDPYETVVEYQARVTEETRNKKVEELKKEAETKYIETYTQRVRFNDMLLKPYDAENRVFLVESKFGELIVPVPRENNKAKVFEGSWSGMQFKDPEYYISNDQLRLASLTFVTPSGDVYRYDGDKNLNYVETVVDISFDPLNGDMFAQNSSSSESNSRVKRQSVKVGTQVSEVDKNIPETKVDNKNTFAVIIANENYGMVSEVPMALNDGEVFSAYCKKTLGLPDNNVRLYKDASYGVMIRAVRDIRDIAAAYEGDLQIIFYYAGHGIPNESTKDAYLLPIDADGLQTEGCYSLARLYGELGALNARSCVVFLDACFSGASREGSMLASARGVALKAKPEAPKGNMVIFSAASGDETALPHKEQGHGLFTYFLLKKLQESKGDVTLRELGDYIMTNVSQQSVVVNHKRQTPSIASSGTLSEAWGELKLNGK